MFYVVRELGMIEGRRQTEVVTKGKLRKKGAETREAVLVLISGKNNFCSQESEYDR
jgi:hypothetical protein